MQKAGTGAGEQVDVPQAENERWKKKPSNLALPSHFINLRLIRKYPFLFLINICVSIIHKYRGFHSTTNESPR